MLQYIKACFEEQTLQSTELQRKTTAIYTARFVQAITALIHNLRKCYINEENKTVLTVNEDGLKSWNNICGVLKQNCLFCWGKWLDLVYSKIRDLTQDLPQEFTLEANIDYLMMVSKHFFFVNFIL